MDVEHDQYIQALTAVGGNSWTKGEHYRIYFDQPAIWAGLEVERYGTGSIASAAWRGEDVSNAEGGRISGAVEKLWFDVPSWSWKSQFSPYSNPKSVSKQEILDAAVEHIEEAAKTWLVDKYGAPDGS